MKNNIRLYRERLAASSKYKERDYWLSRLAGTLERCSFPPHYIYKKENAANSHPGTIPIGLTGEISAGLLKLAGGSDVRLHILLAAGLTLLLHKYTGQSDIIIGTPVFKALSGLELINAAVPLRSRLDRDMTVKELILLVKQTITEAHENRNYPIEVLVERLNIPSADYGFSLFDTAVLVENIHDKTYLNAFDLNMVFSFTRKGGAISGHVEYDRLLYDGARVERIIDHFKNLLREVVTCLDKRTADVDILSESEKRQLLVDFNDTAAAYPGEITIHQVFREQARRTPDRIAAEGIHRSQEISITYEELNRKSDDLLGHLIEKGILAGDIVGIMMARSVDLLIGLLGILKAGAAYLPIDPNCPQERIDYMLNDSSAKIVLYDNNTPSYSSWSSQFSFSRFASNAYVIYTSGTTGRPKGVVIGHRGVVNMAVYHRRVFNGGAGSRVSQVANPAFDAMAFEVWPSLLCGASLHIVPDEVRMEPSRLRDWLIAGQITHTFQPTAVGELLLKETWPVCGAALRVLMAAGDRLGPHSTGPYPFELYNLYGPTEDTVWTTWARVPIGSAGAGKKFPPIGKPIANHRVYIFGPDWQLTPVGVAGELCISGIGLARGYLNNPALTAEKFCRLSSNKSFVGVQGAVFQKSPLAAGGKKLYKTGDLARWLPNGNIEFIGRRDHQVKIRGFRIELAEIEAHLSAHEKINEAVVVAAGEGSGDKYLCAYIVPSPPGAFENAAEASARLNRYLSQTLPDYMIPSVFVLLDRIPLTANGKLDRGALPGPRPKTSRTGFTAPRSLLERTLAGIWAEVLGMDIDRIGIDDNFFQLGGHSLKAAAIVSRLHKVLHVNITLAALFDRARIRELAAFIEKETADKFEAVEPAEEKEYYPLSPPQRRLFILQQKKLASTVYNMPTAFKLEGDLDRERLEHTFRQIIRRHEVLRTSFQMQNGRPVQRVHETVDFEIMYSSAAAGLGSEDFVKPFDLSRAPLLRVGVRVISPGRHILMLDMHHIIADGVSAGILIREFTTFYLPETRALPPLRIQYKDFSQWIDSPRHRISLQKQRAYWLNRFRGEIPVLGLPTDYPREQARGFEGRGKRFGLNAEESFSLKQLAKQEGVTVYMVFLAIYNILLAKLSGREDIVIGTPIMGRLHEDLQPLIGMFVNTLALRNYPGRAKNFREFLREIKKNTLEAFDNQEYPFDNLVEDVAPDRDASRHPLFDVMFTLQNLEMPEITISGLKLEPYRSENPVSRFDLSLTVVETDERFLFLLQYRTALFKQETIGRLAGYFKDIAAAVLDNRTVKLGDIDVSNLSRSKLDAGIKLEIHDDFDF